MQPLSSANWDDIRIFLAIQDCGGLKKAARQLGMHTTSCARRLKSLETALGSRLFDRGTGGYRLTQSGTRFLTSARRMQEALHDAEAAVLGQDARLEGPIRLTLPNGFASHLLMPDLVRFMETYPAVHLSLNMSYTFRDLAAREADVAIRHVTEPEESLFGRRVGRVYRAAYASKRYLDAHNPWEDPAACCWLGWGDARHHLSWPGKAQFPDIPVRGDLYSDVLQLAAVQAGAGIASLPCFLADPAPDLVRIAPDTPNPGDWVWILAHKNMAESARVRTLVDFLATSFHSHRHRLRGEQASSDLD